MDHRSIKSETFLRALFDFAKFCFVYALMLSIIIALVVAFVWADYLWAVCSFFGTMLISHILLTGFLIWTWKT